MGRKIRVKLLKNVIIELLEAASQEMPSLHPTRGG